jgi:nitroreductase
MDFLQLAKMRCTTRGFEAKRIPQADLDYILSASRVAPTACNQQPQRIIVVQQPENIAKAGKAYKTFDSPCVLIVCRDRRNELIRPYDNKCSGDLDIGIICDHIMLAARERNIGSVMVGLFDPNIIRAKFDIPDYIEPAALLFLGYPVDGFLNSERHEATRKPLSDTVMYERYNEKWAKFQ